jgi:hypothetical protein
VATATISSEVKIGFIFLLEFNSPPTVDLMCGLGERSSAFFFYGVFKASFR